MKDNPDHCCGVLSCHWRGKLADALTASHPFKPGKTVYGCPECREIGVYVACEVKDCTWPGLSRADHINKLCNGPFYCDYHFNEETNNG